MCVCVGATVSVGSNISCRLKRFSGSKLLSKTLTPHIFCKPSSAHSDRSRAFARLGARSAYLIDLDDDEQIVAFEIDIVARPDKRRDELNDAVATQGIMVSQGWPNGELGRARC